SCVRGTWLAALRGRGALVLYRLPVGRYTNRSRRSAVGEAFVDDPLLAVGSVGFDEGLPRALTGAPGAGRVGAVFVDRALGPRAGLDHPLLDLTQGPEPVHRTAGGGVGGEAD